jgi:hypothetical protein
MNPTRRRALQVTGTAALTALAGCINDLSSDSQDSTQEYSLRIDSIDVSPVEDALYNPDESALFGDSAQTALANILPDSRHTTYGYEPLPTDAYVEHEGSYYQSKYIVTGRTEMDRQVVRVDPVAEQQVPEDAIVVETLQRPTARVIKILHSDTQTGGQSAAAALLRDGGYVLRRPAERDSQLAAGELDGQVVTMTESGAWAYRVRVSTETITEIAQTAVALEVANSRSQFRDVVFGSRIDAELAPSDLPADPRDILEDAIAAEEYTEQHPISDAFETLLEALELGGVDSSVNRKQLWYDDDFYRYGLYISPR